MGMIKIPSKAINHFNDNYNEIFKSGNLSEGNWNKKLGELFIDYTKSDFSIPFSSNGSGILAVLMLLKKHRGFKNIFIQSNTMYGVKTIAITSGLKFLDTVPCSLPSLMPSIKQFEDYISKLKNPKECVFLITHIGGIVNPDIKKISKLCKEKGIALVEDCAHSLGSTLNGKHSGTFGIAGIYSLYATKSVMAGEGGIVITDDEKLGYQLSKFQMYDRFDQIEEICCNFRISELQALFSYSVCQYIDDIIINKSKIADKYIKVCKEREIDYVDPYSNGQRGNHYKFTSFIP